MDTKLKLADSGRVLSIFTLLQLVIFIDHVHAWFRACRDPFYIRRCSWLANTSRWDNEDNHRGFIALSQGILTSASHPLYDVIVVGTEGSSKMVLLKGFNEDGFVWYTNYESQKAHQLSKNPQAALMFYWDALNRQVRIEGSVKKVSDEESEQYFHSRPRGSQIEAIVSKQSTVIPGRQFLYQQQEELEAKYSDG
ncbi:hypothetical protein OROGR_011520 [Orobanche gracilis]